MGVRVFQILRLREKSQPINRSSSTPTVVKKKKAHKQYSGRLTRWLNRLTHFDVNVQYTAGKNIALTGYLTRHPIVNTAENETENYKSGQTETESGEEFVIKKIHGLFDFIQTNGSIKRFTERTKPRQKN